jgi:hypothetical protein
MYCFQILEPNKNRLIVDIDGVGCFSFKSSRDITRYFKENEEEYNLTDDVKYILYRPHVISTYLNTKYNETNRVYKKSSTTDHFSNIKGFNIYRINGKYIKNPRIKRNKDSSTDDNLSSSSTEEINKETKTDNLTDNILNTVDVN